MTTSCCPAFVNMLKKHFELLVKYKSEHVALLEIRSNALWYLKGVNNASNVKQRICSAKSSEEVFNILGELLINECNKC